MNKAAGACLQCGPSWDVTVLAIASAATANHSVTDRASIGTVGGDGPFPATSQGISQDVAGSGLLVP